MTTLLLNLFLAFFKFGLFCFGGGLAILVLLQETALELAWLTTEQFADVIAISQSTPGPIAINLATFVGYSQAGIIGSLVASIALIIPGFTISSIIGRFLNHFNEEPIIKAILKGLRAVVIGLIATAVLNISSVAIFNIKAFEATKSLMDLFDLKAVIMLIIFTFLVIRFKKHPIYYIITAGIIGVFLWN